MKEGVDMVSFKADVPVDYNMALQNQYQTMPEQQAQYPQVDMNQYPDTFEMTPYGQYEEQPKKKGILMPMLLTAGGALGTFFLGKHFGAKGSKEAVEKLTKQVAEFKEAGVEQAKKIEDLVKENKTLKEVKEKASEIVNKNMTFLDTISGKINKRIKQLRELFKPAEDKAKDVAKKGENAADDAAQKSGDAAKKAGDSKKD